MTEDKRIGWLKELKEGDKVIIQNDIRTVIKTIDKITPTGRIKIGETQYYPDDGREIVSSAWHISRLIQWTQEKEDEIKKQIYFNNMCSKLSNVKWNKLDYKTIESIYNIIKDKGDINE